MIMIMKPIAAETVYRETYEWRKATEERNQMLTEHATNNNKVFDASRKKNL